jgi:large subunit ribosomal protein L24
VKSKIVKGDTVEVIAGKDKGKRGEVIKVMPKAGKIVVQGVRVGKKHQRQVQQNNRNINPGIIETEGPIPVSNVMLVCPHTDKPTRVGVEVEEGVSYRVSKRSGKRID